MHIIATLTCDKSRHTAGMDKSNELAARVGQSCPNCVEAQNHDIFRDLCPCECAKIIISSKKLGKVHASIIIIF